MKAVSFMQKTFERLERQVPPPSSVPWEDGYVLRYKEKTIKQALLLKLARQISGLLAIDILLLNGLFQEQCVIQRTLDEFGEDIL